MPVRPLPAGDQQHQALGQVIEEELQATVEHRALGQVVVVQHQQQGTLRVQAGASSSSRSSSQVSKANGWWRWRIFSRPRASSPRVGWYCRKPSSRRSRKRPGSLSRLLSPSQRLCQRGSRLSQNSMARELLPNPAGAAISSRRPSSPSRSRRQRRGRATWADGSGGGKRLAVGRTADGVPRRYARSQSSPGFLVYVWGVNAPETNHK